MTTPPDELFGILFRDVQLRRVFPDSKTFVDCVPMMPPAAILALYEGQKDRPDFSLGRFVGQHFILPDNPAADYVSDRTVPTREHIEKLWPRLTRKADDQPVEGSSRLPLPFPYVVPGGRFREIFYWDSYFTMLGLKKSWQLDLIRNMLENFSYLIDTYGFIPNGNRTYFLSRSQPPFFASMVQLLAGLEGPDVLLRYLPQLRQEYDFWMRGSDRINPDRPVNQRVALLPSGHLLNRYWDCKPAPRPESYRAEIELTEETNDLGIDPEILYTHIRAACESGWDFSSRWFGDGRTLATIRTADILPVDLNCLLYNLETALRDGYARYGSADDAWAFEQRAERRKEAILDVFWSQDRGYFMDFDLITQRPTSALTLAGAFPLFFKLATPEQAAGVHERLKDEFLKPGGWVTTLTDSGQQWDSPNGWAPLQWIVYRGLMNYGYTETAHLGRKRWLDLNDRVYHATGKMMEKYNVIEAEALAGGGEYPNQDGFGWTNGVYLQLAAE